MNKSLIGKIVLVTGASGSIGSALAENFEARGAEILTLSSSSEADLVIDLRSTDSIQFVKEYLSARSIFPDIVICCNGLLHDNEFMPEKSLDQISKKWLMESLEANLLSHIHLAQALDVSLTKERKLIWVSLSAMVGSIGDNYLGGWYSYRVSKSALNMFIKTLSIEWSRKNKSNRVLAVHPGTTRSKMSAPFNVRKDKLYEPNVSADRIAEIICNSKNHETGQFLNWTGKEIEW